MNIALRTSTQSLSAGWRLAQGLGLVVTGMLVVGLFTSPALALGILWNVLIPILPATFLLSPLIWRALCPLATLNMLPNGLAASRVMPAHLQRMLGATGIVLLLVLVPARRFLFNEHGDALGIVILVVGLVALLLGAFYQQKAGFCNTFCPVLPVEKLYGQHPLIAMKDTRCASCVRCVPKGCLDVAPRKALQQAIGAHGRATRWIASPYGVFAGAFPGFVLGYFLTENGPIGAAPAVYFDVLGAAAASYVVTAAIYGMFKVSASRMLTGLAAAAAGIYYWYAAPATAAFLSLPVEAGVGLRVALLGLVAYWTWRAFTRR
ncbi:MAG: hypothetical protein R2834_07985 [Rhodothermales bacterium]